MRSRNFLPAAGSKRAGGGRVFVTADSAMKAATMIVSQCTVAVGLVALVTPPALACSVSRIPTAAEIVRRAEVIVRARADRVSAQPGRPGTLGGRPGALGGSATQVDFAIVAVLKGNVPVRRVIFNGVITTRDERNGGAVPYQRVRPSGRSGECFSVEYRKGAEYLLMLNRAGEGYAQPDQLTPYWAALAPTNEQVFGANDDWEAWVRARLAR